MSHGEYLFDNQAGQAEGRFDALAALFDPVTQRQLDRLGVQEGWRCLEIGAGGGSVAQWLAARVGPTGTVVATDLDVRWLAAQPLAANIEVRQHDVVADALPEGEFDLVHERLVLVHVPQRDAVLPRLIDALRPGGRLLLEDFDATLSSDYLDPRSADEERGERIIVALRTLLGQRGADVDLGHKLPRMMVAAGLVDVGAESYQAIEPGDATRRLQRANLSQVGDELVDRGLVTRADLDRHLDLLDRRELSPSSPVLVSAWGTRPVAGEA